MNDILAPQAPPGQCPGWCRGDHPAAGDSAVHNSADRQVLASSYTETNLLSVSIEQDAELTPFDRPVVRLEGAASAPMTPSQAMELAAALQQAAFAAVSGGAR